MNMRRWQLIATFLALVLSLPAGAQIHGVPPSVTSLGPHGVGRSGFRGSFGFGHHPRFRAFIGAPGFHHRLHRRFFAGGTLLWSYPLYAPYYATDFYPQPRDSYPDDSLSRELQAQIRDLADAIDRLRDENEKLRQEILRRQPQAAPPTSAQASATESRSTVLVFRGRPQQEVRNYAIVGQTLWLFNENRARKIPLAELDLDQTISLNQERGTDFVLPRP
jgi:hypothetical protein